MENTYTPPKLTELGTVRELTLGNATGSYTDATYPQHTPYGDLTFSG